MLDTDFSAPWWCTGPHCQTIWAKAFRYGLTVPWRRQRLELPDGDFLDLDWHGSKSKNAPIALVLHGLEGSSRSHYAMAMGSVLPQNNFSVVVMNFRGCSGTHNRLARSYHSGETEDIDYVARYIKDNNPESPLFVIGYSLGGNVLLKWLGEQQDAAPVTAAVAVSVPFDLGLAADRMTQGLSRIYQKYFLSTLIPKIVAKNKIIPLPVDVKKASQAKTLRQYDDALTAPLHGFVGAQDYYDRSSSRQYLKAIKVPVLVLHALDDPFMTPRAIPEQKDLATSVNLVVQRHGGHVGFLGTDGYWLDRVIPSYLAGFN